MYSGESLPILYTRVLPHAGFNILMSACNLHGIIFMHHIITWGLSDVSISYHLFRPSITVSLLLARMNTVHCWGHRRWQTNPYPSFVWGEILPVWWNQQVSFEISTQPLHWKEPTLICYPSISFVNALTNDRWCIYDPADSTNTWIVAYQRANAELEMSSAVCESQQRRDWNHCCYFISSRFRWIEASGDNALGLHLHPALDPYG